MINKKTTILIVDDHAILRAGIRALLEAQEDFDVVGEAEDGKQAVTQAIELQPDLVLSDLSMPKTNGTECIRNIKKRLPNTKILVLTVHKSEEYIHTALKAGANGYVLKDDGRDELMFAIRQILSGKTFISPSIACNIVSGYLDNKNRDTITPSWEKLTQREREVLKLIAESYKNKDIAKYLSISPKTVEKHRANMMKKLDLHDAGSITSYALENGLINS